MGSYAGGYNASRQQTDNKQIDKRTAMRNQNRCAALGRPAMKLLCVCVGGGGGASNSFSVDQPSTLVQPGFLRQLVVWFA